MQTLRLASFGIRGEVGGTLTPETVMDFTAAFGTFQNSGRILVARDTRRSSPMYHSAVIAGLSSCGCEILDLGICPTPILQFCADKYDAAGAVSVSAGHCRMGWNAITLISSNGAYIEPVGGETVLDIYHAHDFAFGTWDSMKPVEHVTDFQDKYFDALESHLDADAIRKAGFTVVIDPVNGAGCKGVFEFGERLGLKLVALNADESEYLAHDPEPRPRNAKQVASIVRHAGANIGFVSTSDMSRVSIVAEDCRTMSEEYAMPLIADHVLASNPGTLVTNCCSTRMIDDVAKAHNCSIVKTAVGQARVISALADENGSIGGEGNGSASVPGFSRAFDGYLMMGLILESMAQSGKTITELSEKLSSYHITKKQVYGESRRCYRALETLEKNRDWQSDGTADTSDGLRIDWKDGWIHVRASHTEPMIRIISESESKEAAEQRATMVARLLEREV